MKVCERIKMIVENSNFSPSKVAAEIGISQASLSRIMNCKQEPGINVVINFAKFFHLSTDFLLGLEEERFEVNDNRTMYNFMYQLSQVYDDYFKKLDKLHPKHRRFVLDLIDLFYEITKEKNK